MLTGLRELMRRAVYLMPVLIGSVLIQRFSASRVKSEFRNRGCNIRLTALTAKTLESVEYISWNWALSIEE